MKILVTGATGFIGNHVIRALIKRDIQVIASSRNKNKAKTMDWFSAVDYRPLDTTALSKAPYQALGSPDRMIHLAWGGLPNYKDNFHLTHNLPANINFLARMIDGGLKHLLVAGTCFEYGMQEGELSENMKTKPDNPYGQAKDALRKELEKTTKETGVIFQWARLFYMFGPGQGAASLFSLLQESINNKEETFNMSGGEQIRDFLPVETVAENLVRIALQNDIIGIINVCSGRNATIMELVKEYLKENNAKIKLNPGYYPYPDYEPFRFWGNTNKLKRSLAACPVTGHTHQSSV